MDLKIDLSAQDYQLRVDSPQWKHNIDMGDFIPTFYVLRIIVDIVSLGSHHRLPSQGNVV